MDIDDIHLAVIVDVDPVIYAFRQEVKICLVDKSVFLVIKIARGGLAGNVKFLYVYGFQAVAHPVGISVNDALHYRNIVRVTLPIVVYVDGIFKRPRKHAPVLGVDQAVRVQVGPLDDILVDLEYLEYGDDLVEVLIVGHPVAVNVQLHVKMKIFLQHDPVLVVYHDAFVYIRRLPLFLGDGVPVEIYDVLDELFIRVIYYAVVVDVHELVQQFLGGFHVHIGYQAVGLIFYAAVRSAPGDIALLQPVHLIDGDDYPLEHVNIIPVYQVVVGLSLWSQYVAYVKFIEFLVGNAAFIPDQHTVRIGVVKLDLFVDKVPVVQVYAAARVQVDLLPSAISVIYCLAVERADRP